MGTNDDPAARYPHYRWMSYMVKLSSNHQRSAQGSLLAGYLCSRWNANHPGAPVSAVGIDFIQELTLPGGLEDDPIRIAIARGTCDATQR